MDELEADFISFYGVWDFEELDGPRFLRLASKIIYREGALRAKIQIDVTELEESGEMPQSKPVKTIKMSDAMSKHIDDIAAIEAENIAAGEAPLFERVTV